MSKVIQIFYVVCIVLLLTIVTGCGSSGYSGGSSYYHGHSNYYRGDAWDYDRYYRSGVNRHYHRAEARGRVHRARRR